MNGCLLQQAQSPDSLASRPWQVRTFDDQLCKAKADEFAKPLVSYLLTFAVLEAERVLADLHSETGNEHVEFGSRISKFRVFLCKGCGRLPRSRYYWDTLDSSFASSSTVPKLQYRDSYCSLFLSPHPPAGALTRRAALEHAHSAALDPKHVSIVWPRQTSCYSSDARIRTPGDLAVCGNSFNRP